MLEIWLSVLGGANEGMLRLVGLHSGGNRAVQDTYRGVRSRPNTTTEKSKGQNSQRGFGEREQPSYIVVG